MKTIILTSFLLFSMLLISCSSVKETDPSKSPEGTSWVLKTMKGSPVTPPDAKDITLLFDKSGSKINGFGGCNTFFGSYKTDKDAISITGLGSTKMACDDMNLESDYFNLLQKTDKFKIVSNTLTLYSSGTAVLTFEKK